jgi:hypothetical protein
LVDGHAARAKLTSDRLHNREHVLRSMGQLTHREGQVFFVPLALTDIAMHSGHAYDGSLGRSHRSRTDMHRDNFAILLLARGFEIDLLAG